MILNKNIPFKYIINKVKYDLIAVLVLDITVHFISTQFKAYLPVMPLTIPAFLGTAISVLLSFKMNQSYDRWWEARKVWGAIVNDSRSFVVQLQHFILTGETDIVRKMAYRQIAWCYALGRSLRGLNALEGNEHLLSEVDQKEVSTHMNKPLAILRLNAKDLRELRANDKIDVFSHVHMDNTLVRLVDAMGKAERINGTVFPSTYRLFLHFIIYVFVITLSLSLRDVTVFFEAPLLLLIAVGFFLIEKSAYHLQDPFENRPSDVSVTAIARTIEINIRQLLGDKEVPEPAKPDGFYIL